ncbi:MAG: phosphate ABC transporter permease subunit PstC [Ignavibacteriales bacterium]|nr:phosphate ABC transporter permease subunit PstC [Ignavibacteriales bacterium]
MRNLSEYLASIIIKSVAFVSFAVILLIFVFVFKEAIPQSTGDGTKVAQEELQSESYGDDISGAVDNTVTEVKTKHESEEGVQSIANLTGTEWQPVSLKPKFGLLPLFWGSFKVTLLGILMAFPLAVGAALYSITFAGRGFREILKPVIELLSGFPSVVIGFFALTTVASAVSSFFGVTYRLNAVVGGIALAITIVPIIFTVAEDALQSIPKHISEASLALGATKWQTAVFVILPAATPGIFAAFLLGFGRAFGETMIVLMATGNAATMSLNIFEPVRTLSATIGAEMAEVVFGDTHYSVLFLIGALLFVFTFSLNAIAEFWVRKRLLKKFQGSA